MSSPLWNQRNPEKMRHYRRTSKLRTFVAGVRRCVGCGFVQRKELCVVEGKTLIHNRWLCADCCGASQGGASDPPE